MKTLFIPTLNSGVVYWRMYNFVNAGCRTKKLDSYLLWWQKDLDVIHPWQQDLSNPQHRARIFGEMQAGARIADVIVMGMVHSPNGLVTMQGLREMYGKPVVMEMDDNILSVASYNAAANSYGPNSDIRKTTIAQMKEADALIVSTPYLKEIYSEYNPNVYVVPNCIDIPLWRSAKRKAEKGKIVIGWAGGATHTEDLKIVGPAIDYLTNKYPNVVFKFIHGIRPDFIGKKGVVHVPGFARIDKYPQHIAKQGFDIGIAPLVDNAFNRGKSNLRWLEYSALGIPCVASNVGNFKETIQDGVDALLCDGPEDFITRLEMLITNKKARIELANNARARIAKDFNVDEVCGNYATILQEIAERGQVKRQSYTKVSNFTQTLSEVEAI